MLTGNFAHNNQVTNNSREGGCYSQHFIENHEPKSFPAILHANGYSTFYAGKYLNEYYSKNIPIGYDYFYGLNGNSRYYNYSLNANGVIEKHGDDPEDYYTNVIRKQARNFLKNQTSQKPFLAIISTPSCHDPFTPEEHYKNILKNLTVPRSKNFNVGAKPGEKHWLMTMKPTTLANSTIERIDEIYHQRLETLLTVDDLVEDLIQQLKEKNLLENTFVIFTSDNGFHLGEKKYFKKFMENFSKIISQFLANWAQPWDKRLPYETDIKIPLIIRGPNIPANKIINHPTLLIDLAPTILSLAKINYDESNFDGKSISDVLTKGFDIEVERQMLIEHFGDGNEETYSPECPWRKSQRLFGCSLRSECKAQDSWNNTYSCVRHIKLSNPPIDFLFCKFYDRELFIEAYDLLTDVHQLHNIAYEMLPSVNARYQIIVDDLKQCKGNTCRIIKSV